MKKILLAFAALSLVPLGACETISTPSEISDTTKLDEQGAIGVNLAYKAFRLSVETGVEAGLIKPGSELAIKIADADNKAFAAVQAVDAAYRAGNSQSYADAVARANAAIAAAVAIVRSK